jgi:hypothetical protein
MKNHASITRHLVGLLLLAALATNAPAQPSGSKIAQPTGSMPAKRTAVTPVDEIGPVHAPPGSYSTRMLEAQEQRRRMREQLDFANLDPQFQAQMWEVLVGPDQLDDGTGKAMSMPALGPGGEYGSRDGEYGGRDLLVSLSWAYTQPAELNTDVFTFDMDLNVEGDVAIAGTTSRFGSTDMIGIEVEGTADSSQNWTENWRREYHTLTSPESDGYLEGKACASDLLGNTYVCGSRGDGRYHIRQFNGTNGTTVWAADFTVTATGDNATVFSIVVDPEGILYVAGTYTESGVARTFAARHDPNASLSRTWVVTRDRSASSTVEVLADRRSGIYLMSTSANGKATVSKYGPIDATAEWTWQSVSSGLAAAMDLDYEGNPHVVFKNGTEWNTVKLAEFDGALRWTARQLNGTPKDIKVDRDGNVYVVGTVGSSTYRLNKYTSSGTAAAGFVPPQYGTTGSVQKVALDHLGNPYVVGNYGSPVCCIDLRKFNPDTGAMVWTQSSSPEEGAEDNRDVNIADLLVDYAGSVYVGGYRTAFVSNDYRGKQPYCVKWEQPFVSIPQIATSSPDVRLENFSLWDVDSPETIIPQAVSNDITLFSLRLDQIVSDSTMDNLLDAELDYVFGTVRGGLDFDIATNTKLGVAFHTQLTGGTYDAAATGDLTVAVPGREELVANTSFPVLIEFRPNERGMELISNAAPEAVASLRSIATGDLDLRVWGENHLFVWADDDWRGIFGLPYNVPVPNITSLNNRTILNIFGTNLPPAGTWIEFEGLPGISGTVRSPLLTARGAYAAESARMALRSSLSSKVVDVDVSVTDILSTAAFGVPLSVGWGTPVGSNDFEASIGAGIIQAILSGSISIEQDLDLTMVPYVTLTFNSSSGLAPRTIDLSVRQVSNGNFIYVPASPVNVQMPANATLEITPSFGMRATMRNQSGIRFGAEVAFKPLEVEANLSLLDVSVVDFDACLFCQEYSLLSDTTRTGFSEALNNGEVTIFDSGNTTFNFPNTHTMATISLTGQPSTPQLSGCSRESGRMIIFNQRTPSLAAFNAAAGGTEPMVLYGGLFSAGGAGTNTAYIQHHGRTEALTTTRLNGQALLVQVPRRFFLLPGIARLWVVNGNGKSETIPFTIEYPVPNFTGLADQIWAGDPYWQTHGIISLDGGTPAGNDSFIARRDYYTYLRTTLWNSSIMTGFSNPSISAQNYFPLFGGWETASVKSPPGFPTLVVNDTALARVNAGNDGYYRSRLQEDLYDVPTTLSMQLRNPGPGGGPSRVRTMVVPAPKPVASRLIPARIAPDTIEDGNFLRMAVIGPETVPVFGGYESEKRGNFTRDSRVLFNGAVNWNVGGTVVSVTTEYVSSGKLIANIPGELLRNFADHLITVRTPSGGTQYAEQLRSGDGTWLPATQVNSGGDSVPLTFDVSWNDPEIISVSHPTITAGIPPVFPTQAVDDNGIRVPVSDSHNFSIRGKSFAPDARVYFNGVQLDSTRVSARIMRVTIPENLISTPGNARLWVANGSPRARQSRPLTIPIVP